MRTKITAALVAFSAVSGCASVPPTIAVAERAPAVSPADTAAAFLDAFNALDPVRFDAFFAEDATMFFPAGPFPKGRVEGKAAVTAAFHSFFAMAKERGATRLNIRPVRLGAQDYGTFAVVSFELDGDENLGRRTLVLRRDGGEWRIVHFHASSVEKAG